MPASPAVTRSLGLLLGVAADALFADPRRGHPVAGFGRGALALEQRLYADRRSAGAAFTAVAVGAPLAAAWWVERGARRRPVLHTVATAVATWAVLGGTSLAREGLAMAGRLERSGRTPQSDVELEALAEARDGLRSLCARDPSSLDPDDLARATVESLAENSSDAVVAPLLWGAVAGLPGLVGYRAINTLDAMVGYKSARYRHFGWASARLDDLVNWVPARIAGTLTAGLARLVGGSPAQARRVMRRDAPHHPSPNAGWPEAAAAGALGVRLGGTNVYHGQTETRAALGDGRAPQVADVRRAVRLTRAAGLASALVAAGTALAVGAVVARRCCSSPTVAPR